MTSVSLVAKKLATTSSPSSSVMACTPLFRVAEAKSENALRLIVPFFVTKTRSLSEETSSARNAARIVPSMSIMLRMWRSCSGISCAGTA